MPNMQRICDISSNFTVNDGSGCDQMRISAKSQQCRLVILLDRDALPLMKGRIRFGSPSLVEQICRGSNYQQVARQICVINDGRLTTLGMRNSTPPTIYRVRQKSFPQVPRMVGLNVPLHCVLQLCGATFLPLH